MSDETSLLLRLIGLDKLSPHELRLAQFFESEYPQIAFLNLEEIASRNAVSKATVTRFVRRLGYVDFRAFSRELRTEVAQNFDTPRERALNTAIEKQRNDNATIVQHHIATSIKDMQRTLDLIDMDSFRAIADLLKQRQRPLYLMSVATGRQLLGYFYLLARYLRDNITLLGGTDQLAHNMINAEKNSVLLTTSFDRYPMSVFTVLKYFHDLGAETILITNRRSNPLLRYARHTLFVHSQEESIFKSRSSMLVILEALIDAMAENSKDQRNQRMAQMEDLMKALNIYLHKN